MVGETWLEGHITIYCDANRNAWRVIKGSGTVYLRETDRAGFKESHYIFTKRREGGAFITLPST
jgi:hypothetical protein